MSGAVSHCGGWAIPVRGLGHRPWAAPGAACRGVLLHWHATRVYCVARRCAASRVRAGVAAVAG